MPKLNPIALAVVCALSITGCAAPMQKQAAQVEPPAAPPALAATGAVGAERMYRLGRYLEGQARYENAIAVYREALKRDPLSIDAYTGLGTALAALGRYAEAIREFQAAAVLAPESAQVHNNLGYAYLLGGEPEEAVKALEQASRIDPRHERSRDNLRVARARLAAKPPQAASAPAAPAPADAPTQAAKAPADATAQSAQAPAGVAVAAVEADGTLRLVQLSPQVFELLAPARKAQIEARPLPLLPPNEPRAVPARSARLEVANGNGITGLAKRTAARLGKGAFRIARLTNQAPFEQARTEIQYREGYDAEAAQLAQTLEGPAQLVAKKALAGGVDLRLVLGKDAPGQALVQSSRRSRA